jgi:hypothetical protein
MGRPYGKGPKPPVVVVAARAVDAPDTVDWVITADEMTRSIDNAGSRNVRERRIGCCEVDTNVLSELYGASSGLEVHQIETIVHRE